MQLGLPRFGVAAAVTLAASLSFSDARAQGYTSDFEALDIGGMPLSLPYAPDLWDPQAPAGTTGQDGYYWPTGTTSVPHRAQIYTGGAIILNLNDYAIPDHPTAGTNNAKFIVGNGPAGGTFARAQRDLSYGCGDGVWTFATDICTKFVGTLPTAQNIGSFSVQPFPGGQSFIMLARWTATATATNWNADYVWFDAAGTQLTEQVSDPGFQNLAVDHWYRWETDADLTTNQIVEVRIIDLTTNTTVVNNPIGRYMEGGTAGSAQPTGLRFFAGGSVAGNVIAWDNAQVQAKGSVIDIPGCGANVATLAVTGTPSVGNTLTLGVDAPTAVVSVGSLSGVAFSLAPDPNLPCGTPLGAGVAGNLLIGVPPGAAIVSLTPWAGPGNPVTVPFTLPATGFNGICIWMQGALLDPFTGQAAATGAKQLVIGF